MLVTKSGHFRASYVRSSGILPCLELLPARRVGGPVIGVIDAIAAGGMLALLHAGLSGFLIPPLREPDVRQILGRWPHGLRASGVSLPPLKGKVGLRHITSE